MTTATATMTATGAATTDAYVIALSDSFGNSVTSLLPELSLGAKPWVPARDGAVPEGALVLILAGGVEGDVIELLHGLGPGRTVLVAGSTTDHRLASSLVRAGAEDYFALPQDLPNLKRALELHARSEEQKRNAGTFSAEERNLTGFGAIIGNSDALRRTIEQARRVAQHGDVTVLVQGETGTGKELLARAIHYEGPRAAGPFVEINCAAIPASLLESELFGHEKGAFTGAVATRTGLFEMAQGGTLFLDEIGTMPVELQAKLLRALEAREVRRVGGQRTIKVDVRVIAATHADLRGAITRGEFREDLFYRLNVISLTLPPLRERAQDVEHLAEAFLARVAERYRLPVPPLTPAIRSALHAHVWPGNVRELRNTVERALVLSAPGTIEASMLLLDTPAAVPVRAVLPFPADIGTITRAAAEAMLDLVKNNRSEAARRLGISRPRLARILRANKRD